MDYKELQLYWIDMKGIFCVGQYFRITGTDQDCGGRNE